MKKTLFAILLLIFSIMTAAQSSSFGQNKIQYKEKKWQVYKTDHFDIYYYQGGEELAAFASEAAESSITAIEDKLEYKLKYRVPLILFNSHKDFEETNVVLDVLEEFIGGFTESLKNRVVLPYEGSYSDFRHVINHELTHSWQFEYMYGRGGTGTILGSIVYDVPLWFIEGSAEYFSRDWDRETDMYMRDAVVNDTLIDLMTLSLFSGGYVVYKSGQSVLKYIAETYGVQKIAELYRDIKETKSFYNSLKRVLGVTLETLDDDWKYWLKKRYFPMLADRNLKPAGGKSLLGDEFLRVSSYNVAPSMSPDGNYIAFISEKYGYFDVYMISTYKPEERKRITPRTLTRHYESFHLAQGTMSWSRDSRYLLFSVRNHDKERIVIYDVRASKAIRNIDLTADNLVSPAIDPSNNRVVYSVTRNGHTDIGMYDLNTNTETMITDDIYDDVSPIFLNDSTLIFSTTKPDEGSEWNYDEYRLTMMNIRSGERVILTCPCSSIERMSYHSDSTIVFAAYNGDVSNAYMLNVYTHELVQLTNIVTGVFDPTLSSDGSRLTARMLKQYAMDIILIRNPLQNAKEIELADEYDDYARIFNPYTAKDIEGKNPPFNYAFDWAAGAFSYSPGYGFFGLLDVAVSDMMGNNRLFIQMEKLSSSGNGYLTVEYWNLKRRMDWALIYLDMSYETWLDYWHSATYGYRGGMFALNYPFDRYNRLEAGLAVYQYKVILNSYTETSVYRDELYSTYMGDISLGLVHDDAIWGYFGPVNGQRLKLSAGAVFSMADSFYSGYYRYHYVNSDFRKYFMLTPRGQFAVRFAGTSMFGPDADPQSNYIGGTGTLRGYDYYQYYGKHTYVANMELRFPLIDKLQFAFIGLTLGNIRGVAFTDMGIAKDDLSDLNLITNSMVLDDLKLGFGAGIRMDIWITILQLDVAKHTDLTTVSPNTYWHLGFGAEF